MTSAEFDQLFRAKNPRVIQVSKESGPGIVPQIGPHLRDPDYTVRLLAVNSLAAAGGPQAAELLMQALSDSNEQVRDNAVNALHENLPTGYSAQLLAIWDRMHTRDGYVRQQIPMVLGRLRGEPQAQQIRARLAADPRPEVRDGMIAGLAKLGDSDARNTFGIMLRDARGTRTADLMPFVDYEDEPWVIPLLIPVLHRRDIAYRSTTHVAQYERRECDLAVDAILRISHARFSFEINTMKQYSDAEIQEVLRYAESLPR
jgi:HEAT repeat protein